MTKTNDDNELIEKLTEGVDENRVDWVRETLSDHPHLINADLPSCGWLGSAVMLGLREMTEMLIETGCDVNVTDGFGSLLQVAVTADQPELLQLLMGHGAKFDPDDRPALTACKKDRAVELLEALTQHGIDITTVYKNENTGENLSVMSRAIELDRDDVLAFLSSHGYETDSASQSHNNQYESEEAPSENDLESPTLNRAKLKQRGQVDPDPTMHYLVYVADEEADEDGDVTYTLNSGPIAREDAAYLRRITEHLQVLSDEQYMTGPAALLQSMAKSSYVLDEEVVFWCIEWEPGMIVVRVPPEGSLSWVTLRSPIPDFGGRKPLPIDHEPSEYGFDNNPQYNLIFDAWDARTETDARARGFSPASNETQAKFESAMSRLNAFEQELESRFGDDTERWLEQGKQNLSEWCGDGLRL